MKYHVNREGNPGQCRARKACPFGDMTKEHFDTPAEATKYYEKIADPVHKAGMSSEQLSAFRRNGDFHMRDGDEELLEKMEREEDNRAAGNRRFERFSAIEFERMAEIADAKIDYHGGEDSSVKLDRYTRGVVDRIIGVRVRAQNSMAAIKRAPSIDEPDRGIVVKNKDGSNSVVLRGIPIGDYAKSGEKWEAASFGDWEDFGEFDTEDEARQWLLDNSI